MRRGRHIPLRTCMGCGKSDVQRRMLRIVCTTGGGLRVDPDRLRTGRGGYLHQVPACWTAFARRKGSVRSLRTTIERGSRLALVAALQGNIGE